MSSILTPTGMLSFPHLFVPKPRTPGGTDLVFSLNLVLDKAAQATPEYQALRQAIAETIDEKWGAGKSRDGEFIKKMKLRLPFRPASDRDYSGYDVDGGVFIAPWTKNKPGVVNAKRADIISPSEIWSGQLARCTVHAFAYDTQGNRGVSFNLNNVQIVKADMPRLDGRKSAKDEFGDAPGAAAGPALDDEAPF